MSSKVTNLLGGCVKDERIATVAINPGMFVEYAAGGIRPATVNTGSIFFADNSMDGTVMRGDEFAIGDSVPHRIYESGDQVNALLKIGENVAVDAALTGAGDGTLRAVDAAVAATKTTGVVADNNAILFTATDAGTDGNNIKIALIDPAGNSQSLAVTVSGLEVRVSLATGVAGAITSTAAEVIAAVNANTAAVILLGAANASTSTGAGVVAAVASGYLTGGVDADTDKPLFFALEAVNNSAGSAAADIAIRVK
jgi:hypothetical protein